MASEITCPDPCCTGPDADERAIVCYGPEEPMEDTVRPDEPQVDYTAVAASIAEIFKQKMECCQCEKFTEVNDGVSDAGHEDHPKEEAPPCDCCGEPMEEVPRSAKVVSINVAMTAKTFQRSDPSVNTVVMSIVRNVIWYGVFKWWCLDMTPGLVSALVIARSTFKDTKLG
jgi:hypothetical protein